jgi:hypothetical protein
MNQQMLKSVSVQAATQSIRRRVDIGLGCALLRDRRCALAKKALALLLGVVGMCLIQVLEIPLELLTVIFGSLIGLEDGIEAIVWPVLLACAILPFLESKELVDEIRRERLAM